MLQLLEALARRRVSNLQKMSHAMEVLPRRIFSASSPHGHGHARAHAHGHACMRACATAHVHVQVQVILRIFSFRASARVRATVVSLMAWSARCPRTQSYVFGRYDEQTLKPIKTAAKDYCRLCGLECWEVGMNAPEYWEETGICLSDGGLQSGIFGAKQGR